METAVLVTGLINIGREFWNHNLKRNFQSYLDNFENVCKLDNFMVIWISDDLVEKIRQFRIGKEDKTSIQVCNIEEYFLDKYVEKFPEILAFNSTRNWSHDNAVNAVEYTIPLYNLVVNNKVDFVYKSRKLRAFGESDDSYYVWIDAGYSHNTIDFTNTSVNIDRYRPESVYINRLWCWPFETNWKKFQEEHWPLDVFDGGFIVYKGNIVEKFHQLYYNMIDRSINMNIFDDDQFYMTMLYVEFPELFNVMHGNWFNAANIYIK